MPKQIKDITPEIHRCIIGACPSVFETSSEYIIVGRKLDPTSISPELQPRVGDGEAAVGIPKALLTALIPTLLQS